MRERWSTVIPQRTKQRVGVDLIAWANQKATAIVTAEVIAVRGDGGAVVDDVFPDCAGVEDRVRDLACVRVLPLYVVDATSRVCRVAANCAVVRCTPPELEMPPPILPAELPLIVLLVT